MTKIIDENQQINYIEYWYTKDEYNELSEKEKKKYSWYEWNDAGSVFGILHNIYDKVESLLYWYQDVWLSKEKDSLWNDICGKNVRLIIHRG